MKKSFQNISINSLLSQSKFNYPNLNTDFTKFEKHGLNCNFTLEKGILDLINKIPTLKSDYKDLNFYNIKRMISYLNI